MHVCPTPIRPVAVVPASPAQRRPAALRLAMGRLAALSAPRVSSCAALPALTRSWLAKGYARSGRTTVQATAFRTPQRAPVAPRPARSARFPSKERLLVTAPSVASTAAKVSMLAASFAQTTRTSRPAARPVSLAPLPWVARPPATKVPAVAPAPQARCCAPARASIRMQFATGSAQRAITIATAVAYPTPARTAAERRASRAGCRPTPIRRAATEPATLFVAMASTVVETLA
jgi:hypothetical protein